MGQKYQLTIFHTITQQVEVFSTLIWYKSLEFAIKYDIYWNTGQFPGEKGVFLCFLFFLLETIHIEKKDQGIALYAPGHGLNEVYYAADQWKVRHNFTNY